MANSQQIVTSLVGQGENILGKAAEGTCCLYALGTTLPPGCAVVADDFTNDVAIAAIAGTANLVITRNGSFAAHAANLLRAHYAQTGKSIAWITNVMEDLQEYEGCRIHSDGTGYLWIVGQGEVTPRYKVTKRVHTTKRVVAHPIRESIMMAAGAASIWRVYWPHRSYDTLTFSLMAPGLRRCLWNIAGENCTVARSTSGQMLFSFNAPSVGDLLEIASSSANSSSHLLAQSVGYATLLTDTDRIELDSVDSVDKIGRGIQTYFSFQLLFHDTYESVIASATNRLAAEGGVDPVILCDIVLRSQLTDWFIQTRVVLPNQKDLFQEIPVVPRPPFLPAEDLSATTDRVSREIDRIISCSSWKTGLKEARLNFLHASHVFVIKEWKFFMNKYLFSRYNFAVRRVVGDEIDWHEIEPILRCVSHDEMIEILNG